MRCMTANRPSRQLRMSQLRVVLTVAAGAITVVAKLLNYLHEAEVDNLQ